MYLLRRAASRGLSAQPSTIASSQRTFVTRTPYAARLRSQWHSAYLQRRFASDTASPTDAQTTGETVPPETADSTNASPAEAESTNETVQTEPSQSEQSQHIVEESVATPETADAARTSGATSNVQGAVDAVKEKASQAARTFSQAASNATSAVSGVESSGGRRPSSSAFQEPQPSKILYIGNLFFDVKASQLEREFAQFGTIVNSKVATDQNGLSKGFGYIEYDSIESAAAAIKGQDQQVFEGRRMAVQYHVRREGGIRPERAAQQPHPPSKTLFIGNMSFQMSDKDLNDLFRAVRNVIDVRVAIDRRSGQPRGFAHADFIDIPSAEKAKAVLESKNIYGRQLKVDFSRSSAPLRTSFRGDEDSRGDRDGRRDRDSRGDRGGDRGGRRERAPRDDDE